MEHVGPIYTCDYFQVEQIGRNHFMTSSLQLHNTMCLTKKENLLNRRPAKAFVTKKVNSPICSYIQITGGKMIRHVTSKLWYSCPQDFTVSVMKFQIPVILQYHNLYRKKGISRLIPIYCLQETHIHRTFHLRGVLKTYKYVLKHNLEQPNVHIVKDAILTYYCHTYLLYESTSHKADR